MRSVSLLFLVYINVCLAIYDYIPGSLYQTFAPTLKYVQKVELMKIVFDPHKSRSIALKLAQHWAHNQSPLTEQVLDRSIFEHQSWLNAQNRQFIDEASNLSDDARQLGLNIRSILMNMELSEYKTCQLISDTISKASNSARQELNVESIDCKDMFARLKKMFDVIL